MISLLSRFSSTQQIIKRSCSLSLIANNSKPIYSFSDTIKEFNEMMKQIDEQNIQVGKSQFRQLYFPIKRIHFENNVPFQKIFSNQTSSYKSIKKQGRIMRFFYHLPFFAYYLNYLFFLPTDSLLHQGILASLFITANAKSLNDSIKNTREIGELYINNDAQKYIAVLPKLLVSSNYNELKGKIKGSIYEANDCQGFQFGLDDIESITLLSNDKEKIKTDLTEKFGKKGNTDSSAQKANQAEQKKQILEKLSKIQENGECVIITISKEQWNCSRTFRINLKENDLQQYNDYMIALGYKQRIVMRESMSPNNEQSKQDSQTDKINQSQSKEQPKSQAASQ